MATATTSQDVIDSFEDKVTQIRIMIESQFCNISKLLITRKNKLLQELEEILNKYKQENIKRKEEISELEKGLKFIQDNFQSTSLKEFQSEIVISLYFRLSHILIIFSYLHASIFYLNGGHFVASTFRR